jgi:hypothetical protein
MPEASDVNVPPVADIDGEFKSAVADGEYTDAVEVDGSTLGDGEYTLGDAGPDGDVPEPTILGSLNEQGRRSLVINAEHLFRGETTTEE